MPATPEELAGIPFLNVPAIGERVVNLMPLWDGDSWHLWVRGPEGFVDMRPPAVIDADYLGVAAAADGDFFIEFVDLMWQRMSYPDLAPLIGAIRDDFHNMGVSVAKLRWFFEWREQLPSGTDAAVAATEIEYLLVLARGVFDLLQEAIALFWGEHVRLNDGELERARRRRRLPDTFSKMVLLEKRRVRSAEEILEAYPVLPAMAEEYAAIAPFFSDLRDSRDRVVHGTGGRPLIFVTPRGFCVDPRREPFSRFPNWEERHMENENVSSLLPWIAWVVSGTISACNSLAAVFSASIQLPEPIAPDLQVWTRGPCSGELSRLVDVLSGGEPWWKPGVSA